MRVRGFLSFGAALFLIAGLCLGQEQVDKKKKTDIRQPAGEATVKSLIRKDLLTESKEKFDPPKRDIFSPRRGSYNPQTEMNQEEIKKKIEEMALQEENSPDVAPDITYIGYVVSGQKIIALIYIDEEALAVGEGEMIAPDMKVGKITTKKIEILGPNAKKWEFSIEGDVT